MIFSMTGYGEAQYNFKGNTIKLELRALNGKTIDVRMRLPNRYKSQELALRKLVLNNMSRGKIDFSIIITDLNNSESSLNIPLIKTHITALKMLQTEEGLSSSDILAAVFSIPDIHDRQEVEPSDEEVELLFNATSDALKKIYNYREIEGESLEKDLVNRINNIISEHKKVDAYIEERNINIKDRIKINLDKIVGKINVDENRFEQEVIYYLEKLDINEEQIRLEQNCKYFLEVVEAEGQVKGKKLNFIAQEIGREINTLGSKAQHSDIQRLVVMMKDELEKLKEQLANVM